MDLALDILPIIPHEDVADVDCRGCLAVCGREGEAEIVCNECGAVIRKVAAAEVEAAMLEMAKTDTICSAVAHIAEISTAFRDSQPSRRLSVPSAARE
jgi:hypothetical protein